MARRSKLEGPFSRSAMSGRRWDDRVTSQEGPPTRSGVGYAFCVLGGVALLLHHGWVAGLDREPRVALVFVGCCLMVFNAGGWVAPGVLAAIEGRGDAAWWQRSVWLVLVVSGAAALTWMIGRFVYGVNLFG